MTGNQKIDLEKIKQFSGTFFSLKDVPGPKRLQGTNVWSTPAMDAVKQNGDLKLFFDLISHFASLSILGI